MECTDQDEEVRRVEPDRGGPMSSHIKQSIRTYTTQDTSQASAHNISYCALFCQAGIDGEDELSILRTENALLKKKVKALEKGGRGDKPGLWEFFILRMNTTNN
ncbi:unnamed protein product [Phytophthora fragariaefolia]|uniref:Unnamed protein product n=1 Tax=Phytophthora fragariaefolia TaxID=1490495 RepID=A0A9W6YD03_9STRA|nr:unnamed protein product [Phytophthora fragariaefolia]